MQKQSAAERVAFFREMAANSLVIHEITQVVAGPNATATWVIKKPGSSSYWTQIIVTFDHSLIVHGDATDVVCFSRYHGAVNDTARDVVAWIANKDIQGVTEKAVIGTGRDACRTYDEDVALHDLLEYAEIYGKDDPQLKETLLKAARRLEDEDLEDVRRWVYEETGDPEFTNFGAVTSSRVLWAWFLVQKLQELLHEGIKQDGTKSV